MRVYSIKVCNISHTNKKVKIICIEKFNTNISTHICNILYFSILNQLLDQVVAVNNYCLILLRWWCSHINNIHKVFLLVITLTCGIFIPSHSRKGIIPLMLNYYENLKSIAPCNMEINKQLSTVQRYTFREKWKK